jgi:hypothetical protein
LFEAALTSSNATQALKAPNELLEQGITIARFDQEQQASFMLKAQPHFVRRTLYFSDYQKKLFALFPQA